MLPPQRSGPLFRPETYREDERTVMPVTFPDGSTADLVYPSRLDLASALVVPYSSGTVAVGEDGAGRDFMIRYGSIRQTFARFFKLVSSEPRADYTPVCVYRVESPIMSDYMVFQFERWVVGVHGAERMTPAVRRAWAEGLTARLSPEGFPILGTTGAVGLAARGEHAGPKLEFQKGGPGISVVLGGACSPEEPLYESGVTPNYGRRCDPATGVRVSVNGYQGATVDEVLRGLEVRNQIRHSPAPRVVTRRAALARHCSTPRPLPHLQRTEARSSSTDWKSVPSTCRR